MPANANKPDRWKADISQSEDLFNTWFLEFAPGIFREARSQIAARFRETLQDTAGLSHLTPEFLKDHPLSLGILRMATLPPFAGATMTGLSDVSQSTISLIETTGEFPVLLSEEELRAMLSKMLAVITDLLDPDIFPWLDEQRRPAEAELDRAVTIVADRFLRLSADRIVKEAQRQRQLASIKKYLENRDYRHSLIRRAEPLHEMEPGTFALNDYILIGLYRKMDLLIDAVIQPHQPEPDKLPIIMESRVSGDYSNTYKRRKYQATRLRELRRSYNRDVTYVLFLTGYFDDAYLGYLAAKGVDWVWEHRLDDLQELGI